jgi:hypothetical protein
VIAIAWPDASQHIFYTYQIEAATDPQPVADAGEFGIIEVYWEAGAGWNTRKIQLAPGAFVQTDLATFIGVDLIPHLVYGGGSPTVLFGSGLDQGPQNIFDLSWNGEQWISLQATANPVSLGGSLVAYATPNGQNHVIFAKSNLGNYPPGDVPSPKLAYFSWGNDSDGVFKTVNQMVDDAAVGLELGEIAEDGPLAAYANPDGGEWCFIPGVGYSDKELWAVNIYDSEVLSCVNVVDSAACQPPARTSDLAAYSIWTRSPLTLRGMVPSSTQHVFFTDEALQIWEASTADGPNYTAINLSEKVGAESVWSPPGTVTPLSALAGFVAYSYPSLRFPLQQPGLPAIDLLLSPTITQWLFYVGQDDDLHYISVDDNNLATGSLAAVNTTKPDVPPTALDAYTSPDGSWHVDYSGNGEIQEVYWLNGNPAPNTIAPG